MADETLEVDSLQYLRDCSLIVSGATSGLDLSALRIKFSVKRSDSSTPNTADIYVYNIDLATALQIRKEFNQVVLQAGYQSNKGVIFQGNIKQVIIGRESATDTFINIVAGDGDLAYNYALVKSTLAKGSTRLDQVKAATTAMATKGVTEGHLVDFGSQVLPRGKVLFGNARNYLRDVALTSQTYWSTQNEKINFVTKQGYLPGQSVIITQATGMIGTPQQTNDGVNVKTLLNPNIQVSGRVLLDNNTILQQKLDLNQIAAAKGDVSAVNRLAIRNLNSNGSYYVLVLEHVGDTRGIEWYTNLVCLNIDVSANPLNAVQGGQGG